MPSIIGLALFASGFLYLLPGVRSRDEHWAIRINRAFHRPPDRRIFRFLWRLGTTPAVLLFLFVLSIRNFQEGITAGIIFSAAALLERGVKITRKRRRPFEVFPELIILAQPHPPSDPSFPSGDCLRAWFMALMAASLLGWGVLPSAIFIFLAALITLGRVVLGAHFPLDTAAGSGLGLLAANITLLCWNLI